MKRSELFLMILQLPVDFAMLLLAGLSAYSLRFTSWAQAIKPVQFDLTLYDFMGLALWVSAGWLAIFAFSGLYSTDPNRKLTRDLSRVVLACSTGLAAVAVYVLFTQEQFDSRFLVAAGWLMATVYVSFGRIAVRALKSLLYRAGVGLRRVAVVGADGVAEAIVAALKRRPELGYKVVKVFSGFNKETIKDLGNLTLDEIIFTNPRASETEALAALEYCDDRHLVFKYSADLFTTYSANTVVHPLAGVPMVELRRTRLQGWGQVVKSSTDAFVSLFLLVLLSPALLIIALVILIETGRPIIYKNQRLGVRGQPFFTLKFRSMRQKDCTGPQFGELGRRAEERERELIKDRNSKSGPVYKIADDPRVTPFGRFLRRFSLDELPQIINVLGGSMSLVGPRPHQPREVAGYEKRHHKVFTVKPGVTGLAQISGRSDLSFEDEVRLDVLYIEKWSLWLDLVILVKTPFVLFKKRKVW